MLNWAGKQGREVRGPFSKARTRRRRPSEFPRPEPASSPAALPRRSGRQCRVTPCCPFGSLPSDSSRQNGCSMIRRPTREGTDTDSDSHPGDVETLAGRGPELET